MLDIYLTKLIETIKNIEILTGNPQTCVDYSEGIVLLVNKFVWHKEHGARLFFIGNGGSAAISSHMTADFMKNGGMNTYSLYNDAVTTCMGNDYGYDEIFSRPLDFLIRENDLLVAISSSGNSQNIINAVEVAKQKKATVITFTGFKSDNKIKQMGDINVYIASFEYGIVESIHNLILQQIVDMIMKKDGIRI